MAEITSLHNPLVKQLRTLLDRRREREQQGLAVLEGVRVAEEAAAAGVEVAFYFFTPELLASDRGRAAHAALLRSGARAYAVTPEVLARVADTTTPQGIVGAFRIRAARLADVPAGPGPVLVADGVHDPGNLGTLIRTADALGGAALVAAAGTTDPWSPKVVRAAAGSLFRLPVSRGGPAGAALRALRGRGFRVLATDPAGGEPVWDIDWAAGPFALVIGSEAWGASAEALAEADGRVRVPMPGPAESLNAGVAGAICLYEAMRRRR